MPQAHELQITTLAPLGGGNSFAVYFYRTPDHCPICHAHSQPQLRGSSFLGTHPGGRLELAYQCARVACGRLFVGTYEFDRTDSPVNGHYTLRSVSPRVPQLIEFPESISKISSTFVEIYNQAMAAEASQLDQLTGIGLRKALEFLVKDFAISQKPAEAEKIKATQLGQCIAKYIDDPSVKKTAARATWLGNDETHYVRKWTDRDIEDLKRLVRLTANWIENVLLTDQYEKEMPPPTPKT